MIDAQSHAVTGDVVNANSRPPFPMERPENVDLFATDEEVTVDIPGTPWKVMLYRELDWGSQAELEAAALRGIERQAAEEAVRNNQTIVLDLSKQRMMTLALRITRWNVKRMNTQTGEWVPVPLPRSLPERMQVIRRLRPRWARVLLSKIEELDKENGEGEPEMPALIAPTDEPETPPKATANGDTGAHSEMSTSANTWDGVSSS